MALNIERQSKLIKTNNNLQFFTSEFDFRENLPFLKDVQANIFKPHGRKFVRCLFIRFDGITSDAESSMSNEIEMELKRLETNKISLIDDLKEKLNRNYKVKELKRKWLAQYQNNQEVFRNKSLQELEKEINYKRFLGYMTKTQMIDNIVELNKGEKKKQLLEKGEIIDRTELGHFESEERKRLKKKNKIELRKELKDVYNKMLKNIDPNNPNDSNKSELAEEVRNHHNEQYQKDLNFKKLKLIDSLVPKGILENTLKNNWQKEKKKELENEKRINKTKSIRKWISNFAKNGFESDGIKIKITSAEEQLIEALNFKDRKRKNEKTGLNNNNQDNVKIDDSILVCFYLNKSGYNKLMVDNNRTPNDRAFQRGNHPDTRGIMGDPNHNSLDQTTLTRYFSETADAMINAMILIANTNNNDSQKIEKAEKVLREELETKGIGTTLFTEKGEKLDGGTEPFGFKDGIGQPEFFIDPKKNDNRVLLEKIPNEKLKEGIYIIKPEDFNKHLRLVLVDERNKFSFFKNEENFISRSKANHGRYGSYLVFRKLEQYKDRFKKRVDSDKIMGMRKDGTPLVKSTKDDNEFNYQSDPNGDTCPFNAHIRKANPRNTEILLNEKDLSEEGIKEDIAIVETNNGNIAINSEKKRIVRRSIPYEELEDNKTKVGILFMCYQASIYYQFEYIIRKWCNDPDFIRKQAGVDALIGHQSEEELDLVKFKGMDYLYAPSLPFLKNLPFYKYELPLSQQNGYRGR